MGSADAPGFKVDWEVSDLSRSFGQVWRGDAIPYRALAASAFGLRLFPAVDEYVMAHRAVKYAQLFIVMSFALWWLFEIVGGVRLHPLQYLLVGAGLCAFYLLQLALAEHLGFRLSYALAATAVTVQITLYSWSALHSLLRASGIAISANASASSGGAMRRCSCACASGRSSPSNARVDSISGWFGSTLPSPTGIRISLLA